MHGLMSIKKDKYIVVQCRSFCKSDRETYFTVRVGLIRHKGLSVK
jgi:hypothetical protein